MNSYKRELVEAINLYDENSIESFTKLKDILCMISDRKEIIGNDFFINSLLFLAAQKMRMFGYNEMNGFSKNLSINDFHDLETELIQTSYTSDSGTLLDYHQMKILNLYDSLTNKRMILSAPTSFGKTRLLREIIFKYKYKSIVLIFPTNALLNENYLELKKFNDDYNLGYQIYNNSNISELEGEKLIFVLTPERYLKLRGDFPTIKINFFFMDEVYKIDNFFTNDEDTIEDDRDKIFRIVLYMLAKEVDDYYLAGPYMNLNKLGKGLEKFVTANNIELAHVKQELVKKNIIDCWKDYIKIDKINLKCYKDKLRLTYDIANAIINSKQGSILIYCDSKRSIDILANKLSSLNQCKTAKDGRLKNFIYHLHHRYNFNDEGKIIDWSVKKHIENSIAVHYGSLPKYIQTEMLKLFNENYVDLILSTTSITEGVNTNAKNLIFYGSTKGGKELKVFDVKNIIGRAGRYYHHFVGNIYIFDTSIAYKNNLDESEELDFITFTDKQISYVDIDNTMIDDLIGNNQEIKKERENILKEFDIPRSVFNENRAIDRLKQVELFKILNKKENFELNNYKLKIRTLDSFISKDSHSLEEMFKDLYDARIIEEYEFKIYPSIAKTYSYLGFRGLISYEIKKKKDKKVNYNTVLSEKEYDTCFRNAFNKMNSIVEYKVPKFISLYASIFSYVCKTRGIEVKRENIDIIINYYETGVFTNIGNHLSSRGYPNITIKELENVEFNEMNLDLTVFIEKLNSGDLNIISYLDDYERNLLFEILGSN